MLSYSESGQVLVQDKDCETTLMVQQVDIVNVAHDPLVVEQ